MKVFLGSIVFLTSNLLFSTSAFAQSYDVSGVQILMSPDQVETVLSTKGYEPDAKFKFVDIEAYEAAVALALAAGERSLSTEKFETATNKKTQTNFAEQVEARAEFFQNAVNPLSQGSLPSLNERIMQSKMEGKIPEGPTRALKSMAFHKDDKRETILVEFTAYPSGPFVSRVTYKLDDPNISGSEFRAIATEKYGKSNSGRAYVGEELLSKDEIQGKEQLTLQPKGISLRHRNSRSYDKAVGAAVEQDAKESADPKAVKKATSF